MTKSHVLIYGLCITFFLIFTPYKCYSENINNLFYKFGYSDKLKFDFSVMYNHYNQNNNYHTTIFTIQNPVNKIESNADIRSISKTKDGINFEFGMQVIPPVRMFLSYNYGVSITNINYTLSAKNHIYHLLKDYNGFMEIKDEEHTFLTGLDIGYEYKIKKYIPYINFRTALGLTSSTNYDWLFYSLNIALKGGFSYVFNKNIVINSYIGIDYTSYYNGNYIVEKFIVDIPKDILIQDTLISSFNSYLEYEEIYDKNLSMFLGIELSIYKNFAVFTDVKFINNFHIISGIKFKF